MNKTQIKEKSKMSTFLKVMNHVHVMPTRYKLDLKMGNIPLKDLNPKDGRKNIKTRFKTKIKKNLFQKFETFR